MFVDERERQHDAQAGAFTFGIPQIQIARHSDGNNKSMANWLPIATVADCPPGTSLELVVADRIIALFNVDGTFHALDGVCPHQGGPLGKGQMAGCIVTCPWHGWQFDVRTGQHQLSPSATQPAFSVKQDGDQVFVDVPERS